MSLMTGYYITRQKEKAVKIYLSNNETDIREEF